MSLKFLNKKDVFGNQPVLSTMLHRHLSSVEPGRPYKTIHASELTKESPEFCARERALAMKLLKKPPNYKLTTSEAVTFQIGRDLQDNIVNWFADMNAMRGDWKCQGCGHMIHFTGRPTECTECGSHGFKPEEMRFESAITGASCGLDLAAKPTGAKTLVPVEIKTMDKEQFKSLKMPLIEHKLRTTLYLQIIAEDAGPYSDFIDTSQAIVLYTTKGGYGCAQDWLTASPLINEGFSPFKEFVVKRDDSLVEKYSEKSKQLFDYMKQGVFPKKLCPTSTCPRATKCTVKAACWSGKYEAGK